MVKKVGCDNFLSKFQPDKLVDVVRERLMLDAVPGLTAGQDFSAAPRPGASLPRKTPNDTGIRSPRHAMTIASMLAPTGFLKIQATLVGGFDSLIKLV